MQGFIHIFKLNEKQILQNDIESLLKQYKSNNLFVHEEKNTKIHSVYFTNEYDNYPYTFSQDSVFTPVGIFTRDLYEIYKNLTEKSQPEKRQYVKNLEGQFAIGNANFIKNEIEIFTHIARIETVYYYTSDNLIVVGTDPLIMGLIVYRGNIEFDVESMYSFILNGYYADDLTPYKNIKALPANNHIIVNQNGLHTHELDDIYSNLLDLEYSKKDYDNLTDTFLNAFNTQNKDKKFNLALTGGKDSRLIFAAMNSKNFNLSVFTNGFDDNPDVVIAKKIANMYEINHKVTGPKISDENTIKVNIYQKIKRVMLATSGLVYGYENVGALGKFSGHKSFDGVGAELVKGGFAAFIHSDDKSEKQKLVKVFNKHHQYFKSNVDNTFENFLNNFIDSEHGLHKLQILYSLIYRSGRLTSAAKNASNYSRQSHSPFLDNKFLREALKINYTDNKNEEIHYQIMKRIDKRLIDIPFGKDRWRVERSKPLFAADYKNWFSREPYYPNNVLGNYNWRNIQNNNPEVIKQFKNILLSNPNHLIYDIVDYKKIKLLFSKPIKAGYMRFIWSLASVIIFVNELDGKSAQSLNRNIQIKLPSTSISTYKNKKKILDVSRNFLPLNKSIEEVGDNKFSIKNHDYNRILKSFKGNFSDSPTEVNLKDAKKLNIHVHLTLLNNIEDVKMQILYYKNGKRSHHYFADKTVDNNQVEFYSELNNSKEFDSFRILLYFTKAKVDETFKVNYAFYEITY